MKLLPNSKRPNQRTNGSTIPIIEPLQNHWLPKRSFSSRRRNLKIPNARKIQRCIIVHRNIHRSSNCRPRRNWEGGRILHKLPITSRNALGLGAGRWIDAKRDNPISRVRVDGRGKCERSVRSAGIADVLCESKGGGNGEEFVVEEPVWID